MTEGSVQIEGLEHLRKRLVELSPQVLSACGPTLRAEASEILSSSSAGVPTASGELSGSGFVSNAELSSDGRSVTVTVGYDAEHAAFAHEGFFGFPGVEGKFGRTGEPPKFLERATDGRGNALAKKVGAAMIKALRRLGQR
jgi:hypothetical protein